MPTMSSATIACLLVGTSALASCCVAWSLRCSSTNTNLEMKRPGLVHRDCIALSALLCATASTASYLAFVALWLYSSHGLNGRQPLGAALIWVGILCSVYAFVGGLFARGAPRLLITVSSLAALFLWFLAGAASAAV